MLSISPKHSPPTAPHPRKNSLLVVYSSSVVRTDTAIVDSYKPPSRMAPYVHQPHLDFLDMTNSSGNFTHHIYECSRPPPPPSTSPSRRAMLKLFIIFFIAFTSATLLQVVGYFLILHSKPSSPLHVENQLPLPMVVRPSIGVLEPYAARSTRHRRTTVTSATSTPLVMAVR